jgi:hypothetical protein
MNLLISICLERENIMPLMEIPRELLSPPEVEMVNFITEFFNKYKTVPSTDRIEKEFPYFMATSVTEPHKIVLEDLVDQVKRAKLAHKWEYTLQNLAASVREDGKELPIAEVSSLLKLTAMTTGIETFSSFDRGEYFRKPGLQTGLKLIDVATGGISGGEVMVVAGRLGNKKTTLSLFIAHTWWAAGKRILFASMEMAPSDIFSRLDGIVGSFNPLIIRGEKTLEVGRSIDRAERMVKVTSKESKGEIFIPKTKLKTPQEVFAMAQYLACDGIIIDGLYLMHPNGGNFGSKWERISEISNQINEGAKDVNIPTLALTQIKRVGGRKDLYDPEDIAYSDSIGQDADFVLVSNPSVLDKNKIELQLVKNRFGKEIATICSIDFDKMKLVEESAMTEETSGTDWFDERKKEGEGRWWT